MNKLHDLTISDIDWWFSDYADFEDFVDMGEERVLTLAENLKKRVSKYVVNRLLRANGLPHGPCNMKEEEMNEYK